MPDRPEDLFQTRMALAALFAGLAKAIDGQDGTVSSRFAQNLERLYREARDSEHPSIAVMETLKWTRDLMQKL